MIDAPLALAFASGMVAAVNPCGFAMLPAYVTFFLGHEGDRVPTRGESVARAIPVALAVSLGFVVVFGVVGIVLRPISSTIQEYAPWATIVIGIGLAILGVAMVAGKELKVRVPVLDRGGRSGGLGSMFLYGVSYAIASLTCTIGIFIANIVNAFSRTDFVSGVSVLVVYAAGMGLVITALTVAIALARDSAVRVLRSGMQYANRVAGGLMVLMGAYVAWYGVFSLRVRNDPTTAGGPVDRVEDWSTRATEFVDRLGATTLGLYLLGITVMMVCISVLVASVRRDTP
ncbi:MAG: cytochrome c biogenesis CcdA family protein [Acidimicrobiales bacterium]